MISRGFVVAFTGLSLLFSTALAGDTTNTVLVSSPTAQPTNLRALKYAGCFGSSAPMINHGPHIYQSSGNCQKVCYGFQNTAMALGNGTDCWCGDVLPAANSKVDDTKCSTKCAGYPGEYCGGADVWSVYQTGVTLNDVQFYDKVSSSASITAGPTVTAIESSAPSKGGSTVGIAVGVVVGIVLLAALAGGAFVFFRRKQQRDMEEFKRQNDVAAFTGAAPANDRPQMWAPDNRLDTAGNRNSNGSIADNADYSRRILQVRNPDDGF